MKSILKFSSLLLFILFTTGLLAQDKKKATKEAGGKEGKNNSVYYMPKEPTYGFNANYSAISVYLHFSPFLMNPSGSFVDHEKTYDRTIMAKVLTRVISRNTLNFPAVYHKPNYQYNYINFEYEKAYNENIGWGMSLAFGALRAKRQKIAKYLSYFNDEVLGYPQELSVYRETTLSAFGSYHFMPNKIYDPYVKFRLGLSKNSGDEVHQYIDNDWQRIEENMTNGRSLMYGLSAGSNYYFTENFALGGEISYMFRYIRADQFNMRTLATMSINIFATWRLTGQTY